MNNQKKIIESAKRTIHIEQQAVASLKSLIDNQFAQAVETIYQSKGRVIITGVGKSAIIAQKIVATLNSTGTPSIFMHAGDAVHGDLGTILKDDVVICLSKSGDTPEIKVLVPFIKKTKNTIIAITSNKDSFLATEAHFVLHAYAETEACPNNLAPTTSTTVQLVMGDALAIALLDLRGFSSNDFAKYHPGGALGKKLYLRVSDLTQANTKPHVPPMASLKEVIVEMTANRLGVTAVVDGTAIIGIITDGDLRRMLAKTDDISVLKAKDIMSHSPKTVDHNAMAVTARDIMHANDITQLVAIDNGAYAGIVHIHDLIKEGIV